jgi:GMP synthase (glutamine-hydrolysing)
MTASVQAHQSVLVLDFGSQYTQLIARRMRENRVYCEIHPCDLSAAEVRSRNAVGIILSGGPQSVYEPDALLPDPEIFEMGIPILGICYGMQVLAHTLGGKVEASERREYGRAEIEIIQGVALFEGLSSHETVWMSHGDRVDSPPDGFQVSATTTSAPAVAVADESRQIYGIQFHPEVSHTVSGGSLIHP